MTLEIDLNKIDEGQPHWLSEQRKKRKAAIIEQSRRRLKAQQLNHIRARRAARMMGLKYIGGMLVKGDYDESEHPRDESGRWTNGDVGAAESTAIKLDSSREITAFAIKHFPAGDKFSAQEVAALEKYSGSTFGRINNGLRNNAGDVSKIQQKKTVEALDAAIQKGVTPQDMVVYRGIRSNRLSSLKPGDTFSDHGYVSTSFQEKIATKFGGLIGKQKNIMEIKLPKGTRALAFDAIWDGGNMDEHELLLPRGTTFKITGVRESGNKRILTAEYVAQ